MDRDKQEVALLAVKRVVEETFENLYQREGRKTYRHSRQLFHFPIEEELERHGFTPKEVRGMEYSISCILSKAAYQMFLAGVREGIDNGNEWEILEEWAPKDIPWPYVPSLPYGLFSIAWLTDGEDNI